MGDRLNAIVAFWGFEGFGGVDADGSAEEGGGLDGGFGIFGFGGDQLADGVFILGEGGKLSTAHPSTHYKEIKFYYI